MLRLASDADFNGNLLRGLRRRLPDLDLVRSQDELSEGTPDTEVLAWAAGQNRVLITNDRNTMIGHAYRRLAAGEAVPGLVVATRKQPVGAAIDDPELLAECMTEEDIRSQVVVYLPYQG